MKHFTKIFAVLLAAVAVFASCQKQGPKGPAPVEELTAYPGIEFCKLTFIAPKEAETYKVFIGATGKYLQYDIDKTAELQEVEVNPLPIGEYILRVVVIDKAGNISDPKGVRVKIRDKNDFAKDLWEVDAETAEGSDNLYLVDDDVTTVWVAGATTKTIAIDIKDNKPLSLIAFNSTDANGGSYLTKFSLEVSEDGVAYSPAVEAELPASPFLQEVTFPEVSGRYLKINILGASGSGPVCITELDLANSVARSGQNGIKMGGLTNNVFPFEYDTEKDCGLSGRMRQVTGWKVNQEYLITYDSEPSICQMAVWSSTAFGVADVINGKVWQTIGLDAGDYTFKIDLRQQTRAFYDLFFTVCEGEDNIPDVDAFKAGTAEYLGCLDFSFKGNGGNSWESFDFTVTKAGYVTVGWAYNTYTPGDAWPWVQLYINEVRIDKK